MIELYDTGQIQSIETVLYQVCHKHFESSFIAERNVGDCVMLRFRSTTGPSDLTDGI